ncbi:hypothetical protein GCM10022226_21980 [Sphaerisporangium flaviroseum]|uniref:Uncharacterized protein n=1 Tax=Sphaerisporangium flaviroseum TaxID=509199 RepID=A0ABP7HQC1_9ACTN
MSTDRTDHEQEMERLAVRIVQMNRRDTTITGSDPRDGTSEHDRAK